MASETQDNVNNPSHNDCKIFSQLLPSLLPLPRELRQNILLRSCPNFEHLHAPYVKFMVELWIDNFLEVCPELTEDMEFVKVKWFEPLDVAEKVYWDELNKPKTAK